MERCIKRQLQILSHENSIPFEYSFKELKEHPQLKGYDLKFEINYFVVHVWMIFPPDYPFKAPEILFYNLSSAAKHFMLDNTKKVNICDFSPAMDIRQLIINCYLIFCEILENNEELVELGDVTFPTMEEEIESFKKCEEYRLKFFDSNKIDEENELNVNDKEKEEME